MAFDDDDFGRQTPPGYEKLLSWIPEGTEYLSCTEIQELTSLDDQMQKKVAGSEEVEPNNSLTSSLDGLQTLVHPVLSTG